MQPAAELTISGLRKSYRGNEVLHGIDLTVGAGQFVGLMGANGAGKSTLIKILDGLTPASAGTIRFGGGTVSSLKRQTGVAFIHQDLGLVDALTIVDNLRLGETPLRLVGPILDKRGERREALAALEVVGLDRAPDTLVGDLSPAEKTLVAIARALHRGATLLFVDEATSTLPSAGTARVLDVLRSIVARGGTVVMVTHKLSEILDATERVVVLIDGVVACDEQSRGLDRKDLVRMLAQHESADAEERTAAATGADARLLLSEAQTAAVGPISLSVGEGEIVGLTGLPGSGLHDVAYLANGSVKPSGGMVRIAPGLTRGFVPPHRETQGGFPQLSVRDNLTVTALKRWRNAIGLLARGTERRSAADMVGRLSVHPADPEGTYDALSGGNKQKVIFGRALFDEPDVVILCEPTRGVDAGTRSEIYTLVRGMRERGAAILVVTSDAEDLFALCDRIGVVEDGRIDRIGRADELQPHDLEALV